MQEVSFVLQEVLVAKLQEFNFVLQEILFAILQEVETTSFCRRSTLICRRSILYCRRFTCNIAVTILQEVKPAVCNALHEVKTVCNVGFSCNALLCRRLNCSLQEVKLQSAGG